MILSDWEQAATAPCTVRLGADLWSPRLIRLNTGGNDAILRGLNWDAWFEFSNFKRFDSNDTDLKLTSPGDKK